jgi:NADH-quinone oxidoreductase subunit M
MSSFPWLTVLAVVPLVGTAVIAALPASRPLLAKQVALAASLITLVITIAMCFSYDTHSAEKYQFVENHTWIRSLGVSYTVGVDGISLALIAMSAILVPVVLLAAWDDADDARHSVKLYFSLLLVLETAMVMVFASLDLFLFYVFFEAMLLPVYFLIGMFGGSQRQYAAVKFLLYSLFGGLLMLAALVGIYVVSGHSGHSATFDFRQLTDLTISNGTQKALFLGFFAAFAIKAPMWPVHTWLPDAAAESTPGTAVLLVGVLDKVGTFGMIRYCLELFPDASRDFAPFIVVLSVIGVLYGALLAIGQTDMMRLIAYTSVSHFGFITLGIFALTTQGQSGSTLYMVNHGFSTAGLFLLAGFMIKRRGSRQIADYGGVQRVAPILAGTFLVVGLSGLALPGLSSFVSEFLVLVGTYVRYPVAGVVATIGIVLAAIYVLWWYQRAATGPARPGLENMRDLGTREVVALAPVLAIIIALGFFPKPLLDVINPAVHNTLQQVNVTDPSPHTPVVADPSGTKP